MRYYPRLIKLSLYRDGWNFYFCNEGTDKIEKRYADRTGLELKEALELVSDEMYRAQRERAVEDCEVCTPKRWCPDHGASLCSDIVD